MLLDFFCNIEDTNPSSPCFDKTRTRQFDAAITVLLQNYTLGAIHYLQQLGDYQTLCDCNFHIITCISEFETISKSCSLSSHCNEILPHCMTSLFALPNINNNNSEVQNLSYNSTTKVHVHVILLTSGYFLQVMDNSRGFIRSRQPAKIAAYMYLVRICLLPPPTLICLYFHSNY